MSDLYAELAKSAIVVGAPDRPAFTKEGRSTAPLPQLSAEKQALLEADAAARGARPKQPAVVAAPAKPVKKGKTPTVTPAAVDVSGMVALQTEIAALHQELNKTRERAERAELALMEPTRDTSVDTIPLTKVVIHTSAGNLRVNVRVLDSADAVTLVFPTEDDIVFTPNYGDKLAVSFNGRRTDVVFPGVLFPWLDKTTFIMVLLKHATDSE